MLSKDLKSKNYVHTNRFNKHLETLTLRGSNVGIKAKIDSWFNKCNKINPELYSIKYNIPFVIYLTWKILKEMEEKL